MNQRFWVLVLCVLLLVASLVSPIAVSAHDVTTDAPIVVAAESEEEDSQGSGVFVILLGLIAVGAVGGFYILADREPAETAETEEE